MGDQAPTRVVGAAVIAHGRVLAGLRGPGRALAGLWEFPGGKVETGEDDEAALKRELREELALTVSVGERIASYIHHYGGGAIELVVYACENLGPPPVAHEHQELGWFTGDELGALSWCPADIPILEEVARRL